MTISIPQLCAVDLGLDKLELVTDVTLHSLHNVGVGPQC